MAWLYPSIVGPAWQALPPAVLAAHFAGDPVRLVGTFAVGGSGGAAGRWIRGFLRLPQPTETVAAELEIRGDAETEVWNRHFGSLLWVTVQSGAHGILLERAGQAELAFRLDVVPQGLRYEAVECRVRAIGRWWKLSSRLAPRVTAVESEVEPGVFGVTVRVEVPGIGLLLEYHGQLTPEALP